MAAPIIDRKTFCNLNLVFADNAKLKVENRKKCLDGYRLKPA